MNNFIDIIDSIIFENNTKDSNVRLNYEIYNEQEYNKIKLNFSIKEDTKVIFSTYVIVNERIYQEYKEDVTYRFQMQVIKDLLKYSLKYLKLINTHKID